MTLSKNLRGAGAFALMSTLAFAGLTAPAHATPTPQPTVGVQAVDLSAFVMVDDSVTMRPGETLTFNVLDNDTVNGDFDVQFMVMSDAGDAGMTIKGTPDGNVTIDVSENYFQVSPHKASFTFMYFLSGEGIPGPPYSPRASVTLNVEEAPGAGPIAAPVARNDKLKIRAGRKAKVNVARNDTYDERSLIMYDLISKSVPKGVKVTPTKRHGVFRVVARKRWVGKKFSFRYRAGDVVSWQSDTAKVTIKVKPRRTRK